MNVKIGPSACFMVLAVTSFGVGCSPKFPDTCRKIVIDSAGVYCFNPARIRKIRVGPGGPAYDAAGVEISPPTNLRTNFDNVSSIFLMADLKPLAEPDCIPGRGVYRNCVVSVQGKELSVTVLFTSEMGESVEEKTKLIAKEVAETDNVIKKWYRR